MTKVGWCAQAEWASGTCQGIREVSDYREQSMTGHREKKEGNVYRYNNLLLKHLIPTLSFCLDKWQVRIRIKKKKRFSRTNQVSLQQAAQASWSFRQRVAAWWRSLWIRLWQLLFMFHRVAQNNICIMYKMHRCLCARNGTKIQHPKSKWKLEPRCMAHPSFTSHAKQWRSTAGPYHSAAFYWPPDVVWSRHKKVVLPPVMVQQFFLQWTHSSHSIHSRITDGNMFSSLLSEPTYSTAGMDD